MTKPYRIDLTRVREQREYPLGDNFRGVSPDGRELGFTNTLMMLDGKPFFAICGELHYSRVSPDEWDDSVLKLQAGGINVLSTYVFWNVHEEREGAFRFDGQRDLRRFLEICKQRGMLVILRIGPFGHGEMRNGGMPDWLYGKPFEARSLDAGFLDCVRRLYGAIHSQADGYYYGQGGTVVGIQLDNEYMHSSAPWEATAATTNEWINGGSDGEDYIRALRLIARETGMVVPFYTATAWGGAMAPTDETLPLWGGYAYRPWIFYDHDGEHPATPEYIYRDNHNDAVPETYNFEPRYAPESMPFACCEMMGGMFCSYRYRFTLPFESVDAMANIKLGSGCNMLGYYMYRGGTTPLGERTPYLNESQVPQRTYDFQAPVGENGQLRPSWYRLRTLHELCAYNAELFSHAVTVLPPHSDDIAPEDTQALRYCVRVSGSSGFVFVNNFQDHIDMQDREGDVIELRLPNETLRVGPFDLKAGENAVLPFNMRLGSALIKTATAQPITTLRISGETCAFFFAPEGMRPVFAFDASTLTAVEGCPSELSDGMLICHPTQDSIFLLKTATETIRVFILSRANAMRFSHFSAKGGDIAVLADTGVLVDGDNALVELCDEPVRVLTYPSRKLRASGGAEAQAASEGMFEGVKLINRREALTPLTAVRLSDERYTVDVPQELLKGHKAALLRVEYMGDVGQAFLGGEMISDNFCNGSPWELRLDLYAERLAREPLTLHIVPVKEGKTVNADTTMAARMQSVDGARSSLGSLTLVVIDEIKLSIG